MWDGEVGLPASPIIPQARLDPQPQLAFLAVEQGKLEPSGAAPAGGTHPSRWHTDVSGDIRMSTIRSS